MSIPMEQAIAAVRKGVERRLKAQQDGKPSEQWYEELPQPDDEKAAGYKIDQGDPEPSCCEGRPFRGDSLLREQRHPSSTAFVQLLAEMQRLHESKSADYGSEEDPLANVRSGADFVNIEPWRGCMVRIADKVQRLRTFCRTGRLVHEGVRDTLLDLAAYSLLAIVLFDEGNGGS